MDRNSVQPEHESGRFLKKAVDFTVYSLSLPDGHAFVTCSGVRYAIAAERRARPSDFPADAITMTP
ncbi:hypothetical protein [Caballeronia ptereochthonis]|uniref:hypothetical protein n=1 Tax=Caballeronia ptereochthonis TaxID=1777144 RepID=UPI00117DB29F|nr:hypothetical protein [Caballeronia ptereochthonis]